MLLRLSSPAARALLVLVALVLVGGFSYSGIRNTLAVRNAGRGTLAGYERATQLQPDDADHWYLLGRYWQYNLEEPDSQRAISAYRTALTFDSHSADTWLDLATAYESEADTVASRNAFLQARRMYPLSPEVAWRYGNFLLRHGELTAAFTEIRRAVEVDPKRGAAAFALARRFEPNVIAILDHVLPRSRDAYFSVISSLCEQQQTDQAMIVWSKLATLNPTLKVSDAYPLIEALIHKRQMVEAQLVWNQALNFAGVARPADPTGSLVWDGRFESDIVGGGFAWRYPASFGGVQITFDTKEKHAGNRSLRLTFNGLRNVDFHDVCQIIAVQPATAYRFSAWVSTRSLSTDQGVRFGLQSLSDSVNSIVWTDDVHGDQPWTQVVLPWTSGPDVRELQLCVARRPSAKFDSKIRGSAWIDDVALVPGPAEHTTK